MTHSTRPAAAAVPRDPQRTVRPSPARYPDQPDPVAHWETLIASGAYPVRNPPAPSEVVAQREANDALFRTIAADRRRRLRERRA